MRQAHLRDGLWRFTSLNPMFSRILITWSPARGELVQPRLAGYAASWRGTRCAVNVPFNRAI